MDGFGGRSSTILTVKGIYYDKKQTNKQQHRSFYISIFFRRFPRTLSQIEGCKFNKLSLFRCWHSQTTASYNGSTATDNPLVVILILKRKTIEFCSLNGFETKIWLSLMS